MLTKEELSLRINGREYTSEITPQEEIEAKQSGLVVIFGASDDLVEMRGALSDEVGAYDGASFAIQRDGTLLEPIEDDDVEILKKHGVYEAVLEKRKGGIAIQATWAESPYSWIIDTKERHATFDIMEDGNFYCRGIVIDLKELAS